MTDRRTQMQRSRRRTSLAVYGTTAALFAVVGGSLSVRMAQGQDPSLGSLSAKVTQTSGHHHKGWTAKPLRTTASGHVIKTSQPASTGSPSAAPAANSTTRHHTSEGHDA